MYFLLGLNCFEFTSINADLVNDMVEFFEAQAKSLA